MDPAVFGTATKNLARKLNTQVSKVRETREVPDDGLRDQDVFLKFRSHIGFPDGVDSLAYDSGQKLLAIGTRDGRVKIIGCDGVECMLIGEELDSKTVFLGFLKNRAELLRVSENGKISLFNLKDEELTEAACVSSENGITDVAVVPGGPYMLLGCDDGHARVIHVGSNPSTEDGIEKSISFKPYKIFREDLEMTGDLVCIESVVNGDRPFILFVYSESGALVWDVRAEKVLSKIHDTNNVLSRPTCACWVGDRANCFAIGYEDGSIIVWGMSASTLKVHPSKISQYEDSVLVLRLEVSTIDPSWIKSVKFVRGTEGTPYGKDCLLVLGGQTKGTPDMLSLVSLEPEGNEFDVQIIPWFGEIISHTLLNGAEESRGNGPCTCGILILTEGGQIVVHDLASWEPLPVSLKFQELPPITCSSFMPSIPLHHSHSPSLKNLRYLSWKRVEDSKWPFNGGVPPANYFISETDYMDAEIDLSMHPSGVLLIGHRDGRVRVWDAVSQVPKHMCTVPQSNEILSEEGRLMPVICFDVCPMSGILAVGHAGGIVRVYQFSNSPQSVRKVTLGSSAPYDRQVDQGPGWQYVMQYSPHSDDITAVSLASQLGLLAVGDRSGCVSLVNLSSPARIIEHHLRASIVSLKFSIIRKISGVPLECTAQSTGLFCLAQDGSLDIIDCDKSVSLLSKPLRAKNQSKPLHVALLNSDGSVLPSLSGELELPWADNNSTSKPRTLGMTKISHTSQGRRLGDTLEDFDPEDIEKRDSVQEDDLYDINTDADLWSDVPRSSSLETESYPNDSFYSSYFTQGGVEPCNMILIGSADYLRLYSIDAVFKGERSSERKVKFDKPILSCSSFHSISGSGLLTLSKTISCYTLPGLHLVGSSDECSLRKSADCLTSAPVSMDGQVFITLATNEILRFSSLVRAPPPIGPQRLVMRQQIASKAVHHQSERSRVVGQAGLSNILGTVKGAATAASGMMMQEIEKISKTRDLPNLGEVFQKEVYSLDDEVESIPDEDPVPCSVSTPMSTTVNRRSELLGSKSNDKVAKRTASTIKRQYRPATKTDNVRSVMERNRDMLDERGRKLRNLEDQSAALQNDTQDFASMAQDLEKAFADRKWWHF